MMPVHISHDASALLGQQLPKSGILCGLVMSWARKEAKGLYAAMLGYGHSPSEQLLPLCT